MKIALVLFVGCLAVAAVSATEEKKFTTKYDNIDLDQILKNERLFTSYHKCLMGTGNCTPDGSELKESLPEAIKNDCAACSEKQKDGGRKVIRYTREHYPDLWAELKAKYDPDNKYEARHPELHA